MTTAERIRHGRKTRGWSQAALGERVGVSQVQVSLWETGKASPSPEQLARLEAMLGEGAPSIAHQAVQLPFPEPPASPTEPSKEEAPRKKSRDTTAAATEPKDKSLESWIWDAACSIRGAKDAGKYKDFILPLIFTKRLCDVFDDELNRIATQVRGRTRAFQLVRHDKKLVRFYLPLEPKNPDHAVWSVIRTLSEKIGERLTTHLRAIADANPLLKGIIDRVDFNATTHGVRDLDDDRLSALIEKISAKRLGLSDVEPDIIGRSYEYLIRKFAEGAGQSGGELYTPAEVGFVMARLMAPEPGMTAYDPTCGSAGLLIKLDLVLRQRMQADGKTAYAPLKLHGQEYEPASWAMANMNMIIHDLEGRIEIGNTFKNPKFRAGNRLQTFDRVVANPMWNQDWFKEQDYEADPFDRFPKGAGYPGNKADWGWMQHILASLNHHGRAAVVLDTGAASRGSGNANTNKEKDVRRWFVEQDVIEGVLYLPENLFYNTTAPGIVIVLNKAKAPERRGKLFLLNASREFVKGDPKNYLPDDAVVRIADAFTEWREVEKYSRVVTRDEVAKNDFNISPSRYIHTGDADEYRPIPEIVEELEALEAEARATDAALKAILRRIGV
ncbi:MAG: N-6 DNA methylase [Deferrisomatales bacterium]